MTANSCGCTCHVNNEFNAVCFSCNCDFERVQKTKIICLLPEQINKKQSGDLVE